MALGALPQQVLAQFLGLGVKLLLLEVEPCLGALDLEARELVGVRHRGKEAGNNRREARTREPDGAEAKKEEKEMTASLRSRRTTSI